MKKSEKNKITAYFSVPTDFKKCTLKKYKRLNERYPHKKIGEVYGNLPQTAFGSGRASWSTPVTTIAKLKDYIKECKKYGIGFNYTFNAMTLGNREYCIKEKKEILAFFRMLYNAGVRRVTITLPTIVSLISSHFKDMEITLSIINGIETPHQLSEYARTGRLSRVYVSENLNRKLNRLKKIVSLSRVPIATMLNNSCLFECAFRTHHYNFMSFLDDVKEKKIKNMEFYAVRCAFTRFKNHEETIKTPWIRPEDVDRYSSMGIQWFKISGRETIVLGANIPKTVETYMKGTYDGNIIALLSNFVYKNTFQSLDNRKMDPFFKHFFNKKTDCDRELCPSCGMCKRFSTYIKVNKSEQKYISTPRPLR